MENKKDNDFLSKPINIDYTPYLDKKEVQLWTNVIIVGVGKGTSPYRPSFVGEFPHGVFRFDFCIEEMRRFVDKYGDIPLEWIDLEIQLKADPYKKKGFRLTFKEV